MASSASIVAAYQHLAWQHHQAARKAGEMALEESVSKRMAAKAKASKQRQHQMWQWQRSGIRNSMCGVCEKWQNSGNGGGMAKKSGIAKWRMAKASAAISMAAKWRHRASS